MNCGERRTARRHPALRADRRRRRAGLARRHPARQRRRRRADRRRRHRPGRADDPVARARHDQHPHGRLRRPTDCTYAYSAGDSDGGFTIFDLRNLDKPHEVDARPADGRRAAVHARRPPATSGTSTPPASARTPAGTARRCGRTDRPAHPRLITTTGKAGPGRGPATSRAGTTSSCTTPFRPNAHGVRAGRQPVLQATATSCSSPRRTTSRPTARRPARSRPGGSSGSTARKSAIVPLDKVELADLGNFPLPQGALLLVALVRLPPGRPRRGRLLRRRHPDPRRPRPPAHQVLRLLGLGRLGGVGRDVGAGLRRGRHSRPAQDQHRLLDRPGPWARRLRGDAAGQRRWSQAAGASSDAPPLSRSVVPLGMVGGALALAAAIGRLRRRRRLETFDSSRNREAFRRCCGSLVSSGRHRVGPRESKE